MAVQVSRDDDFKALQFDRSSGELKLVRPLMLKPDDPYDVVIRVKFAGVCGTDLHIVQGNFPCSETPIILGHEISGVVQDVGPSVTHVSAGDTVVVNPNSNCGRCQACLRSNPTFCEAEGVNNAIGIFRDGGWAEICRVSENQVFKLPDGLNLEQAVLCEPLSSIAHAWDLITPVPQGTHVLVVGAGIIGTLLTAVFHVQGYRHVIVTEAIPARRELVHRLETRYEVVNPAELRERHRRDPNWGVDLAVDCSGSASAMEEALTWLRPAGRLLVFGVSAPEETMAIKPFDIFVKELKIIGSLVNPIMFPQSLDWAATLGRRYLNYSRLGIQTFPLHQYNEALDVLKEGKATKVIFEFPDLSGWS